MDDSQIVALFWNRDERAIKETALKYGQYCFSIANHILNNQQDAEECVNDTYQGAWTSIPPNKPEVLATYLGKITRRLSLKILRNKDANKRGNGEVSLSLEELASCLPTVDNVMQNIEFNEVVAILNSFLAALPVNERRVFVRRYWYANSINEICKQYGFSKSKVESMLHRTRKKLKKTLEQEGYIV